MSNAKDIRKQVRNVVQENLDKLVTDELTKAIHKDLDEKLSAGMKNILDAQSAKLDNIEKFCQEQLKKMDERARNIQGWIVREVQFEIANKLHNAQVTLDAFIEVIGSEGVKIDGLNEKVDAKKAEIQARMQQEAEARMKDAMQQTPEGEAAQEQPKAEEEAKSEEQPATEVASA